jgi:transposase
VLTAQATVVGLNTACVLWTALGDVRDYDSGPAYRKAMGLNLKERSSGRYQGQLKITKRGPGRVRRWLYFTALRECQKPEVKKWFEAKKGRENGCGGKAVVAIMRKLALALYQVGARGAKYESRKLFPGAPPKSCQPAAAASE